MWQYCCPKPSCRMWHLKMHKFLAPLASLEASTSIFILLQKIRRGTLYVVITLQYNNNISKFSSFSLSDGETPFEIKIHIPKLKINSKYSSSGVLIILPASGNGTFHSVLGDVHSACRGMVSTSRRDGLDYLHIDSMSLDLEVKTVKMMVKKVFNHNRILSK